MVAYSATNRLACACVEGDGHGAADPQAIDEAHQKEDQQLSEADRGQFGRAQPADHQRIDDPDAALKQVTPGDWQSKADERGKGRGERSGRRPHSLCQSH
jgi:hypothetical protein